jgi:hypothetical protein
MKSTTLYLGIFATLLSTFTHANSVEREEQKETNDITSIQVSVNPINKNSNLKKQIVQLEDEIKFMDSLAMNVSKNEQAIQYIIEENKKITESAEEIVQPLYINQTIEEVIKEDNQIIESNLADELFLLDFEVINKSQNAIKNETFINNAFDKKSLKS